MTEKTAVYYGQVELIPNIFCDGYVLNDGIAVLSERGTADLLGMKHSPLQRMAPTWPPKSLKPFIDNKISMAPDTVQVTANTSPYKGRNILVYTAEMVETLIWAYLLH